MPHLQVDYFPDIGDQPLLDALVAEFCKIKTVDPAAVKAYSRPASFYNSGAGAPAAFVHLTICVLKGRPREVLEEMSQRLHSVGAEILKSQSQRTWSWTVEVREMDSTSYRKSTIN